MVCDLVRTSPGAPAAVDALGRPSTARGDAAQFAEQLRAGLGIWHRVQLRHQCSGGAAGGQRRPDGQESGPAGWRSATGWTPGTSGQGLATAAAAALTDGRVRAAGRSSQVEIVHDEANVASGGVPRKLGFTEIARRPHPGGPEAPAESGTDVVWRLTRPGPGRAPRTTAAAGRARRNGALTTAPARVRLWHVQRSGPAAVALPGHPEVAGLARVRGRRGRSGCCGWATGSSTGLSPVTR